MDYIRAEQIGNNTVVQGIRNFNPAQILECGQCFRWQPDGAGYVGIAHGRRLQISLDECNLILEDVQLDEFNAIWRDYFDLGRDYSEIIRTYASDPNLAAATAFSPGLRVMRQDPWETLVTFIFSQNSNIPRIRKMVMELCMRFGDALPQGGRGFPGPDVLAGLTANDLAPVKPGYRAAYISDAAKKVASGTICLQELGSMSTPDMKKALLEIRGVGPKVADCVALFGYGRVEICPMDVWMNRVMEVLYPAGFPEEFTPTAGIAQQYLFHYARNFPERFY